MNKNLLLAIVVLLLVGILGYLKYNQDKSNFSDAEFRVENVDKIYSIEIQDKYGQKTQITRKKDMWMLNDSLICDQNKLNLLLNTIHKLQVEVPIGDSVRAIAIDDIRKFGVQVTLKDSDGDEIKTMFIGSNVGAGNYMILSKNGVVSPDPYIVNVPGAKSTDLKYRFLAEPKAWISSEIFATPIDKIKEIKINFATQPNFSFTLTKDDELIEIKPMVDSMKINKQLNRDHVLQFLLEFENKHFESKLYQDSIIQMIKAQPVHATIEVTDVFDKKRTLTIYRIPKQYGTIIKDPMGKDLPFNVEKYWGYVSHTKDYAIVQHYVFGPVLLPYSYFFEEK